MKRIFLFAIIALLTIHSYKLLFNQKPVSIYLSPDDKILYKNEEIEKTPTELESVIKKINEQHATIQSIHLNKMNIRINQNGLNFRATAELAMEKNNKFRFKARNMFSGMELDIGSNNEYFWFWSEGLGPNLYYSEIVNINKNRLRTALNPTWMIESMNTSEIDLKNYESTKVKDFLGLTQERIGSMGEKAKILILIDQINYRIIGRYLYDLENKLIISSEYSNFNNNMPRKMYTIWYEEKISLEWYLDDVKLNSKIDNSTWSMPKFNRKINIRLN